MYHPPATIEPCTSRTPNVLLVRVERVKGSAAGRGKLHPRLASVVRHRPHLVTGKRAARAPIDGSGQLVPQAGAQPAPDRGPALALAVVGDQAVGHRRGVERVFDLALLEPVPLSGGC